MPQANGLNPTFQGKVTAIGYDTPGGMDMKKIVRTNGSTLKYIFGTNNGFNGTITGFSVMSNSTVAAVFSLRGSDGTICEITSGSQGQVRGSVFEATAFYTNGSLFGLSSSGNVQGIMEVSFTSRGDA